MTYITVYYLSINSDYCNLAAELNYRFTTKTSWHLWADHEASSTMLNFHLGMWSFLYDDVLMESNIA